LIGDCHAGTSCRPSGVALLESLTGAAPSVGFVRGMLARAAALLAEVDQRCSRRLEEVPADELIGREIAFAVND
jgi:hypothetical protein